MKCIVYFLIYVYMTAGFLVGIRLPFKYTIARILSGMLYAFIWFPDLIAKTADEIMSRFS